MSGSSLEVLLVGSNVVDGSLLGGRPAPVQIPNHQIDRAGQHAPCTDEQQNVSGTHRHTQ